MYRNESEANMRGFYCASAYRRPVRPITHACRARFLIVLIAVSLFALSTHSAHAKGAGHAFGSHAMKSHSGRVNGGSAKGASVVIAHSKSAKSVIAHLTRGKK